MLGAQPSHIGQHRAPLRTLGPQTRHKNHLMPKTGQTKQIKMPESAGTASTFFSLGFLSCGNCRQNREQTGSKPGATPTTYTNRAIHLPKMEVERSTTILQTFAFFETVFKIATAWIREQTGSGQKCDTFGKIRPGANREQIGSTDISPRPLPPSPLSHSMPTHVAHACVLLAPSVVCGVGGREGGTARKGWKGKEGMGEAGVREMDGDGNGQGTGKRDGDEATRGGARGARQRILNRGQEAAGIEGGWMGEGGGGKVEEGGMRRDGGNRVQRGAAGRERAWGRED
jgi:hypothetical protein